MAGVDDADEMDEEEDEYEDEEFRTCHSFVSIYLADNFY